jgi:hypothetical protein
MAAMLPTGKSASEQAMLDELFRQFDLRGNGYLSLVEVNKGVQDILRLNVTFFLFSSLLLGVSDFYFAAGPFQMQARNYASHPSCEKYSPGISKLLKPLLDDI